MMADDVRSTYERGKWRLANVLWPLLVMILAVLVWQAIIAWWQLPHIILPSPRQVLLAAWRERQPLWQGLLITGQAALVGLIASAALGSLLAILFSQSARLRTALFPYVIFLQTVPIVAIAPLLIIWSGNGFRTIVLIVVIISIFPIVANVTAGLISIDQNLRDLFQLYSASRWQTLTKLRIPGAIPHLVLGLRISCGLAVIGAIVGEFFVSNGSHYEGLGAIMNKWQGRLQTDALMAAVAVSTMLGVLFFSCINLLGRTLLGRWTQASSFESEH